MKVDIVKGISGWSIHPRIGAPGRWDDGYETPPLFGPTDYDSCVAWCEDNGHSYRVRQLASLVNPRFIKDVEKRCDGWFKWLSESAEKCGRKLVSDTTYRASAAWKEEPTHYCYVGDMGGTAHLQRVDETKADADALIQARSFLDVLFGASDVLWELGYTLTFDKNGKHTIFNKREQWVTLDEAE